MSVGVARIKRADSFLASDRVGALTGSISGAAPRDFSQIFNQQYANPFHRSEVELKVDAAQITTALLNPNVIELHNTGIFTTVKFGERVRQVLTDTSFTDLADLPAVAAPNGPDSLFQDPGFSGAGFHIRLWKRQGTNLEVSDVAIPNNATLITQANADDEHFTPPSTPPLQETIFHRPVGSTNPNEILITYIERFGARGTHATTQHFVRNPDADSLTVTTHDAIASNGKIITDGSGPALHKQVLTYSQRGPKVWDYTIDRIVSEAVVTSSGAVGTLKEIARTQEVYKDFSSSAEGGENGAQRMTKNIIDSEGAKLTTTYVYFDQPSNSLIHGRLKSALGPDGSWERWVYNDSPTSTSATTTKYSSWKNVPLTSYQSGMKEKLILTKSSVTKTRSISGKQISREVISRATTNGASEITRERTMGLEKATTVTGYNPSEITATNTCCQAGRPAFTEHPDGTASICEYSEADGNLIITKKTGAGDRDGITDGIETITTYNASNSIIDEVVKSIDSSPESNGLLISRRQADLTFTMVQLATHFQTGLVVTTDSNTVNGVDGLGRPLKWIYNNQDTDFSIEARGCCGPKYSRSRSGALSLNHRDRLRRIYHETSWRAKNSTPIDFLTDFDGLTTTVNRKAGGETLFVSKVTRTLSGLTTTSLSPDADGDGTNETTTRVTTYPTTGGSLTTTTYPDLTTTSATIFRDGSMHLSKDQENASTTYDKGVINDTNEPNGGLYTLVTQPGGTEFVKVYRDQFGRAYKTEYADSAVSQQEYFSFNPTATTNTNTTTLKGSRGKLKTSTDPDENASATSGNHVSYAYNTEGELVKTTTRLANNESLIQQTEQDFINDSNIGVSARTVTSVVTSNGIVTTSTSLRDTTGYKSKSITLSGTSTSSRSIAVDGAWTTTSTSVSNQTSLQTYSDGLLQKSESFTNVGTAPANLITSTSYLYDDFARPTSSTDFRTGLTTMGPYLENGAVTSVTTNNEADTTSYTYDNMGRRLTTTLPDDSVTHTSYTPRSQVKATWGSQTYPRHYRYDAQGRMVLLRTKPNLNAGGVPQDAGGSTTSWTYSDLRGFLIEKNHDGEADNGPGGTADYAYTASGRLMKRTWERGEITNYSYDQGVLSNVDYKVPATDGSGGESDDPATQNIAYTYDELGRPKTVTQGGNVHTYAYKPTTLVLDTETLAYDTTSDGSADFTRLVEHSRDGFLRPSGVAVKATPTSTPEQNSSYQYDTASRLWKITDHHNKLHTYGYEPGSYGLVASVSSPAHTVANTYEPHRNVLTIKENTATTPASVTSAFTYTVNKIGQRTDLTTTGSAFADDAAPVYVWGYNSQGELISADDSSAANNDRSYQYDLIGNRIKSANSLTLPTAPNYQSNGKNQYTSIVTSIVTGTVNVTPSYDDDGNATSYPLPANTAANATLVWDGENRLIEVISSGTSTKYSYDYLSRRISKTVGIAARETFIYSGWNLIAEYTSNNLRKTYTCGMDLSGSMQGAGGVGGILAVHEGASSYYPTYDGNGNVSEYLNSAGVDVAHYEYDAFGNTTVATGSKKEDFAHRFSTKYHDQESGLYYYGYRYYDPATGRWPSRDPIGEVGHETIKEIAVHAGVMHSIQGWLIAPPGYIFCGNRAINFVDVNGEILGLIVGGAMLAATAYGIYKAAKKAKELAEEAEKAAKAKEELIEKAFDPETTDEELEDCLRNEKDTFNDTLEKSLELLEETPGTTGDYLPDLPDKPTHWRIRVPV